MTSASSFILLDDADDGFDWDAAVREIDSACAASTSAASTSTSTSHGPRVHLARHAPTGGLRQSTIDRFVARGTNTGARGGEGRRPDEEADRATERWGSGDGGGIGVEIDLEAAKTWIYPVNLPVRQYQLSISEVALFQNTLVALPTGLGKTFIAAVVMYNYLRWFPEGKIVFAAPSRPLVMQQIDACLNIVGIPRDCTIDLTGLTSPLKRSKLWDVKKVFFVTPQVLEKDIHTGICPLKQLVCIVIDEAHRAKGNYSYCVVVRNVMSASIHLRILALTATPGSKQQDVQKVIDNLQISRLEYRSETDRDVSPYVQNREYELIQVALGKDAVTVDELLLQVIKPYVNTLSSAGVLQSRDFATMSPYQILSSRDKFRSSLKNGTDHLKYQEIDGSFATLLTFSHVRKLLSSHGVKPAYDMLDEKLKEWPLLKLRNNEFMCRALDLMFKSLSHGAPNPKLLKMIEILAEHFKLNDPKSSRVIIFSSFRGSVRAILASLIQVGKFVKATEFIGQSSGKILKGQNQKVQQAVLQKFRDGEYNVIVATSIGEEGLDIMEVDLVICFDANISPLRMTQRMGRTGRKNDGRVVVLACEGQEMKGYLRKQANSKAIKKHMHKGGNKSFSFHSSPRMVPHICKPEVQFVEVSVNKPASVDKSKKTPLLKEFTEEESFLIDRYFNHSKGNASSLSLIAFPHFQAFPSRVYKVHHSFNTSLFISTVQCLHEVSQNDCKIKDFDSPVRSTDLFALNLDDNSHKDLVEGFCCLDGEKEKPLLNMENLDKSDVLPPILCQLASHNFIFNTEFVSVDSFGNVMVAPVPQLSLVKGSSHFQLFPANNGNLHRLVETVKGLYMPSDCVPVTNNFALDSERTCMDIGGLLSCKFKVPEIVHHECPPEFEEMVPVTPHERLTMKSDAAACLLLETQTVMSSSVVAESDARIKLEMNHTIEWKKSKPRIDHFVKRGLVPESPVASNAPSEPEGCFGHVSSMNNGNNLTVAKCARKSHETDIKRDAHIVLPLQNQMDLPTWKQHSKTTVCDTPSPKKLTPMESKIQAECNLKTSSSPNNGFCTPNMKQTVISSSDEWQPTSEAACMSVECVPRYKRLRKYVDTIHNSVSKKLRKEIKNPVPVNSPPAVKNTSLSLGVKGQKNRKLHAMSFIDEEAEVSDDAEVSEDECGHDDEEDEYDDSFIDDKVEPTVSSIQAEDGGDMIAFYRRSLLTQSPADAPRYSSCTTHNSSKVMEIGSSPSKPDSILSGKVQSSARLMGTVQSSVGQTASGRADISMVTSKRGVCLMEKFTAASDQAASVRNTQHAFATSSRGLLDNEGTVNKGKRKLSSQHMANAFPNQEPENKIQTADAFSDDEFYSTLDFDALEEQATEFFKTKPQPQPLVSRSLKISQDGCHDAGEELAQVPTGIPSFDLGI